jgi:formylglycine-generating enzyme required for sulfatase activity
MKQTIKEGAWRTLGTAVSMAIWLTAATGGQAAANVGVAENDPAARFRGPLVYDFGVTNVKWEAATPDYSYVTFDLYWSYSWRAKWTEPAEKNVTGKPLDVENWDAAWVFVKFLLEKDSKGSIESNLWRHATLDTDSARHVMPAGATNMVGASDDGSRGMGVFIYRDAVGHGVNDFKGIKLRWMTGADPSTGLGVGRVDPAKAAVKVLAIPMVYVSAGAFKLGSGVGSRIPPFPDGPNLPSMQGGPELGSFTDGSWRGGSLVPFLVDAEWNGPAAAGSRARRLGAVAGQLWGIGGYVLHCTQSFLVPYACSIGLAGTLNDDYPTGYEAFYCMKYQVTQGQYVEFLNSLPRETAAALATVPAGEFFPKSASPYPWEGMGLTIIDPGKIKIGNPTKNKALELGDESSVAGDAADMLLERPGKAVVESRPVYTARLPNRTCNYLMWADGFAYAAWAGLRPMTELEFEKVCRGPLNPVPGEHAWGSTDGVACTNWHDADLPTERSMKGNYHGWESDRIWNERATRAGIFATPDSDRFQAGATYWGILDMELFTFAMSAATTNGRAFCGSHGDGSAPAGPRLSGPWPPDWCPPGSRMGTGLSGRYTANIPSDRPPTYPSAGGGRSNRSSWRGVRSASVGKRSTVASATAQPGMAGVPTGTRTNTVDWDVAHDTIKVGNVKCEVGSAQYSTVTCDIEWENSWRAKWTEPAEKNVTGKPLSAESWDAAWVFVKFRNPGDQAFSHAILSSVDSDYKSPAGATLNVGVSKDGSWGLGVFVYRAAVGVGANSFKGIKLRWMHSAGGASAGGAPSTGLRAGKFDPAKAELVVHAIPMVYVPGGPFQTKGPWGHALSLISSGDATKPGGHRPEPAPLISMCWDAETDAKQTEKRRQLGSVPKSDSWPNGYRAFYCTKYSITQGQYADFLNSLAPKVQEAYAPRRVLKDPSQYTFNRFTIHFLEDQKRYVADVPDRLCNQISWGDIFAYKAWAGLRPLTDMEYEKACRGPRSVARAEDAWDAAACARADGLEKVNLAAGSPAASYWGVRELSLSGIQFEWPLTFHNELGLVFKGTHGNGTTEAPQDWMEVGDSGEDYEDRLGWGTQRAVWIDPSDVGRIPQGHISGPFWDRTGRYGVHAARTAPIGQDDNAPLQVAPLPPMTDYDVYIFNISGSFRNEGDKSLKVELASSLLEACFPEGPSSRGFTAAPKSATPFKILTALPRDTVVAAVRADRTLPVRIVAAGGNVLAELALQVQVPDPKNSKLPVIESVDGGAVTLRLLNTTERPVPVTIEMSAPVGLKIETGPRRVEAAAGQETRVAYAVPRQGFPVEGIVRLPYRVTVASGVPLRGEKVVERRTQTRWWVCQGIGLKRKAETEEVGSDGSDANLSRSLQSIVVSDPQAVFQADHPPKGWEAVTLGADIPFGRRGAVEPMSAPVLAATRMISPAGREAVIGVQHKLAMMEGPKRLPRFSVRIWINGLTVYDSLSDGRNAGKGIGKPSDTAQGGSVLICKGRNTVLVECRSLESGEAADPGTLSLRFNDAKDGKDVKDLIFDMGDRQEKQ